MQEQFRTRAAGYIVAVVATAIAVAGRSLLHNWLQGDIPLLLFVAAVTAAAWYGGFWPGVLATCLGAGVGTLLFIEPAGSFVLGDFGNGVRLVVFLAGGFAISALYESLHHSRRRLEAKQLLLEQEIVERRQAEATLRESDERLLFALEAAKSVVWDWKLPSSTPLPHVAAGGLLGLPDLANVNLLELVHPKDAERVAGALREASRGNGSLDVVYRILLPSGQLRWIASKARLRLDSHTGEQHLTGVCLDITERMQAEEALRGTQARFQRLFESEVIGFFTTQFNGPLTGANDALLQMLGYTRQELREKPLLLSALTPPEYRAADERASAESSRTGKATPYEKELIRKDGSRVSVLIGGARLDDSADEAICFVVDLTQRKEIEAALQDSEQRFHQLADSMPQIVYIMLPDGRIGFINRQWTEYTGLTSAQTENVWQVVHPDDVASLITAWHGAQATGLAMTAEFRLRRAGDGAYRWFLMRSVPIRNAQGEIVKWFGTSTDIDDRKQAEQAVRDSERMYRAIGESIDYGIWISDAQGRNLYTSEAFLKLVGLTQRQCCESGWNAAVHPDEVEPARQAWLGCLAEGGDWDREYHFRGVDGEWHPVLTRGKPVRNEAGEIIAWAGINLDINRLKQAEAKLLDADRRKDEFLATLAHELRNPLAPIRNALQMLNLKGPADPLLEEARDLIERQVLQMSRIIDDLLDISRIAHNKLALRRAPTQLAKVVRTAVEMAQPLIDAADHELTVDLPQEEITLFADPARLAQVLSNLLNNAAKYSLSGSRIWLSLAREGSDAVVRVRDNGMGIPAELLPRLFTMYTQSEHSLERSQGGLGIGLTLVKRLVEMHSGSVEARSEGAGRGSEFIVRLPMMLPETPPPETSPVAASSERVAKRRILVVDDNQDAATSLSMLLNVLGNETSTAHDGLQAVAAAESFQPDLILLDIGLPKLNGYEAAQQIRELPGGKSIVLVALTGWGQDEDRRRSQEAGFNEHLVKPVDLKTLQKLLTDTVDQTV